MSIEMCVLTSKVLVRLPAVWAQESCLHWHLCCEFLPDMIVVPGLQSTITSLKNIQHVINHRPDVFQDDGDEGCDVSGVDHLDDHLPRSSLDHPERPETSNLSVGL